MDSTYLLSPKFIPLFSIFPPCFKELTTGISCPDDSDISLVKLPDSWIACVESISHGAALPCLKYFSGHPINTGAKDKFFNLINKTYGRFPLLSSLLAQLHFLTCNPWCSYAALLEELCFFIFSNLAHAISLMQTQSYIQLS